MDPNLYNITWKNGSTGTYVNGNLLYIDKVRITGKGKEACCVWEDKYSPPTGPLYYTVTGTSWVFPANWACFTIRVKAINPEGICTETEMTRFHKQVN